jgi:hypothetical protein
LETLVTALGDLSTCNRKGNIQLPFFSGKTGDWSSFIFQWENWLSIQGSSTMNDAEKITRFGQCLDSFSQKLIRHHQELGKEEGRPATYDQIFKLISETFEPKTPVMKSLWQSVKVRNPKGSSLPTLEDWDDFEIRWKCALGKIPEVVSTKEQYELLITEIPGHLYQKLREKECMHAIRHPLYLIQGVCGKTPKQILIYLQQVLKMPQLHLDNYLARENIVMIRLDKGDEDEFKSRMHNHRLPSGERVRAIRQEYSPTPITEIFAYVRMRIGAQESTKFEGAKGIRRAEREVAMIQGKKCATDPG